MHYGEETNYKGLSMIKSCLISCLLTGFALSSAIAGSLPQLSTHTRSIRGAPPQTSSKVFTVDAFDEISINGPLDVEIIANTPLHDIRLVGDSRDLKYAKVKSRQNTLNVTLRTDNPVGHTLAIIRTGNIRNLRLVGKGQVKAIGLHSPELGIHAEYQGPIRISGDNIGLTQIKTLRPGNIDISGITTSKLAIKTRAHNRVNLTKIHQLGRLDYSGNGTVILGPLQSHYLHVTGQGDSTAVLRGKTDVLELTLHGLATFDGSDLQTNTAFANTYQGAQAHLHVLKAQYTLATDDSSIMFYKNSRFIGNHTLDSGALLNYSRIELQAED
jgi:Putative auto-transporter adhesin, head GIN domain